MRKLYHYWLCPFSRKIRITLAEKKLSFDAIVIKPWEVTPSFLALNPEGVPPVLTDDDGKNIANAYPIAEYLEEVYFEPSLLGQTSAQRAEVRRLIMWFDDKFNVEVTHNLVYEKVLRRKMGQEVSSAHRSPIPGSSKWGKYWYANHLNLAPIERFDL